MSFWEQFPYTNFHEMNLEWLLKEVSSIRTRLEQYTAINRVAYAGVWNITKQYPQWSIVSSGDKTYMSSKAVPSGVDIVNEDYWIHLADIDPRINGILQDIDMLEETLTRLELIVNDNKTKINNVHIVNVLNYGAIGDGETDDTAAFQRAIDNTPVHGTLYIPYTGESYIITSTLHVRKPISVIGGYIGYEYEERVNNVTMEVIGKPLIRYTGSDYAFDFDTLGYYISGISIVSDGGGFYFHLTNAIVPYSRIGKINNCQVTHNGVGFKFEKAFRVTLDNVNSYGGVVGFMVEQATSFLFNNTWARDFSDSGYNITNASYCGFNVACCDGTEDKPNLVGYYISDSTTISFSGCGVENCALYGLLANKVRGGFVNMNFVNCGINESGCPINIGTYSTFTFAGCSANSAQTAPKVDLTVEGHSVATVLTSPSFLRAKVIESIYTIADGIWSSENPGDALPE